MIKADNTELASRKAIIYFPGLMDRVEGDIALDVARRVSRSLDEKAQIERKFVVAEYRNIDVFENESSWASVASVHYKADDNTPEEPFLDIIAVPYTTILTEKYNNRSPISQLASLLRQLFSMTLSFVYAFRRHSNNKHSQLQIIYAACLLGIVLCYIPILGAAIVSGTAKIVNAQGIQEQASTTQDSDSERANRAEDNQLQPAETQEQNSIIATLCKLLIWFCNWSEVFLVYLVALGLFTRHSFKEELEEMTKHIIAANAYLTNKNKRALVIDYFGKLIQTLGEDSNINYSELHVWGYSFGSIAAIDVLWPKTRDEALRSTELIDKLVTIGSPVQFLDKFQNNYFNDRIISEHSALEWTNIYDHCDILSTQFENSKVLTNLCPHHEMQVGHEPGAMDILKLVGFTSHSQYWNKDSLVNPGAFNCVSGPLLEKKML